MQDLFNFIIPCGSGHFKKEFVKFCARTRRIGKIARNERHRFRAKKLQSGAACGILKIAGMHNGFRPAARPPAPEPEAAAASSQTDHPDAPEKQLNSHQKRKRENQKRRNNTRSSRTDGSAQYDGRRNHTMKKLIPILLAAAMLLVLAGCGGGDVLKGTWVDPIDEEGEVEKTWIFDGKCPNGVRIPREPTPSTETRLPSSFLHGMPRRSMSFRWTDKN